MPGSKRLVSNTRLLEKVISNWRLWQFVLPLCCWDWRRLWQSQRSHTRWIRGAILQCPVAQSPPAIYIRADNTRKTLCRKLYQSDKHLTVDVVTSRIGANSTNWTHAINCVKKIAHRREATAVSFMGTRVVKTQRFSAQIIGESPCLQRTTHGM